MTADLVPTRRAHQVPPGRARDLAFQALLEQAVSASGLTDRWCAALRLFLDFPDYRERIDDALAAYMGELARRNKKPAAPTGNGGQDDARTVGHQRSKAKPVEQE